MRERKRAFGKMEPEKVGWRKRKRRKYREWYRKKKPRKMDRMKAKGRSGFMPFTNASIWSERKLATRFRCLLLN